MKEVLSKYKNFVNRHINALFHENGTFLNFYILIVCKRGVNFLQNILNCALINIGH